LPAAPPHRISLTLDPATGCRSQSECAGERLRLGKRCPDATDRPIKFSQVQLNSAKPAAWSATRALWRRSIHN